MSIKVNRELLKDLLKKLCELDGASGQENSIIKFIFDTIGDNANAVSPLSAALSPSTREKKEPLQSL